ncbi:MAG: zinc ribbon protein [Bacteroidetes bacterium]|jgi:uncharacterized membrane protein YgcG|nr:zinc ribbon protein [Bacteroidota bacterium]
MKKIVALLIAGLLIFISCKSYKQISLTKEVFYKNKDVIQAFSSYNVYVHDEFKTYYLATPEITDAGISGVPHPVSDTAYISKIKKPSSGSEKKEHRYDLNIYTKTAVADPDVATANAGSEVPQGEEKKSHLVVTKENIKEISLSAVDKKRGAEKVAIILLVVILGIIVVGLLLALIVGASSNGSSGGSNSGGSNSSGSDSGGSGSSGSCYIATMAYGSYDAPEVMVLRKFRDDTLSKTLAGRTFIKVYYKYSPLLVEKLKHNKKANDFIRGILDKWVTHLSRK